MKGIYVFLKLQNQRKEEKGGGENIFQKGRKN